VGHHNIQTIGRATLKDYDQPFAARTRNSRAKCGTSQKAGDCSGADDGEGSVTQKDATSNGHKKRS
jgi:hypothetical protein